MAVVKVRSGGVWVPAQWKTRVGGAWNEKPKMRIGGAWVDLFQSVVTSLTGTNQTNILAGGVGSCFAGIKIDSNGIEYAVTNVGGYSSLGTWLDSGTTAEVWVRCTVTAGSIAGVSPTGSWLATTVDREWYVQDSNPTIGSSATATILLEMATDSGGANIIDSQSYNLSANLRP